MCVMEFYDCVCVCVDGDRPVLCFDILLRKKLGDDDQHGTERRKHSKFIEFNGISYPEKKKIRRRRSRKSNDKSSLRRQIFNFV